MTAVHWLKRGDEVKVKEPVPHHRSKDWKVTTGITCTVQQVLGNVVMVVPHNCGHEVMTYDHNLVKTGNLVRIRT